VALAARAWLSILDSDAAASTWPPRAWPPPGLDPHSRARPAGVLTLTGETNVLTAVVSWVLRRTVVGRHLYAVGGDAEVARMVGIRTGAVVVAVFVLSGTLAALAGFVLTVKATVGTPSAGSGLELDAITACVLGGISLSGGRGSLPGAVGGVILLTLIQNVFTLLHISSYFHDVVLAFVILAAVAVFVRRD
jgi:ribose transport system permease protein